VRKQTGRTPPELDGPACPELARHLWEWFGELHAARTHSGLGPNPISWPDLDAWSRLTGVRPSPSELYCLRALDAAWFAVQREK